jgi:predicted nucleic acid-binding protein
MIVFVDTSVWSLALRRLTRTTEEDLTCRLLADLVRSSSVGLIGPVKQEVLTGIRDHAAFERLREHLRSFREVQLIVQDFENGAQLANRCRSKGIQGSPTDFLLCAVASRHEAAIFTTDRDFQLYAKHLHVRLHKPLKN